MEAFNDYTYRFLETIEKLGLTDYKVWNTLENLSKATMSKIRRGICGVSMNTLQEFCQIYNVNANYILTGKGNMFLNSESPALLSKEEVEGMPSPESAKWLLRGKGEMYKSEMVEDNTPVVIKGDSGLTILDMPIEEFFNEIMANNRMFRQQLILANERIQILKNEVERLQQLREKKRG